MKKAGTWVLGVLTAIGVIRGVIHYTADGGAGFHNAAASIILSVEDITYRWIPVVLDWISTGAESAPSLLT